MSNDYHMRFIYEHYPWAVNWHKLVLGISSHDELTMLVDWCTNRYGHRVVGKIGKWILIWTEHMLTMWLFQEQKDFDEFKTYARLVGE